MSRTELEVCAAGFDNQAVQALACMTELQELGGNELLGPVWLACMTDLRELKLGDNGLLGAASVAVVAQISGRLWQRESARTPEARAGGD